MDLGLTQVKPREIGVFVDNLKRLLIKWEKNDNFSQPNHSKALAKMGFFFQIQSVQNLVDLHFSFTGKL